MPLMVSKPRAIVSFNHGNKLFIISPGGAHGLIGVDPGDGQFEEALDAGDGGDADVDIDAVRLAGQLQVN